MEAKKYAMNVIAISPFLWTMDRNKGMPSVYNFMHGLVQHGHKVDLFLPSYGYRKTFEYRDGPKIYSQKKGNPLIFANFRE